MRISSHSTPQIIPNAKTRRFINMAIAVVKRLPAVRTLFEILPKGAEGGKEFGRLVDLLLFHEARRQDVQATLFNDASGDYKGLDSLLGDSSFKKRGAVGFQYKFYPSPLSDNHRHEIEVSLEKAASHQKSLRLKKWVLVTPMNLVESSTRTSGGDVTWFDALKTKYRQSFELEQWGHTHLISLFLEAPYLALFYYPELVRSGSARRRTIEDTQSRYRKAMDTLYNDIQFVGMSVYEQEAARGVEIKDIYIPLKIVPETVALSGESNYRLGTSVLTARGSKHVVLGDPGSGKTTLLRFLALSGTHSELQTRYGVNPDKRLSIYVVLRKYADEPKSNPNLGLLDYIIQDARVDLSVQSADLDFFEYFLESGEALLLFDGLDELPNPAYKSTVRNRIRTFTSNYPGNTVIITSRIVGYDEPFSFSRKDYFHTRVALLQLPEIEQFVSDWYAARIDNLAERRRNVEDLLRIVRDVDHTAIRELATNPLLLTIVTLVHRIDAILPDERVVLYQKCTETLLNTWHSYKFKEPEQKNRGRVERRNRSRIEAIAHWMQNRSMETASKARAVAPFNDIHNFLTGYISAHEIQAPGDLEPIDAAADFLEFVRKKAGLLVEAGDEQYSFVHLTFQEYLTSTFIITLNEAEGIAGIWKTIEPHITNVRWNEVIRLLIGGLRAPTSQAALLERLFEEQTHHGAEERAQIAELMGGFLLDRIEAAETKRELIVNEVLVAASATRSESMCARLLRIVKVWQSKDYYDGPLIQAVFMGSICPDIPSRVLLLAPACDLKIDPLTHGPRWSGLSESEKVKTLLFFSDKSFEPLGEPQILKSLVNFRDFVAFCAVTNPVSNRAAARLQSFFYRLTPERAAEHLFHLHLSTLIGGLGGGPYSEFTANLFGYSTLELGDRPSRDQKLHPKSKGTGSYARELGERALYEMALGVGKRTRNEKEANFWRGRDILSRRVANMNSGSELKQSVSKLPRAHTGRDVREERLGEDLTPDLNLFIGDSLSRVFDLRPAAQWGESIQSHFVPNMNAVSWTRDARALARTVKIAERRKSNVYLRAWLILLVAWHNFFEVKLPIPLENINVNPFPASAPAIGIATVIHGLSAGDESLVGILKEYLSVPEYRIHFEAARWTTAVSMPKKRRTSGEKLAQQK